MDKQRLEQLFRKYTENRLTPSEKEEFYQLMDRPESQAIIETLALGIWNDLQVSSGPESATEKLRVKRIVRQANKTNSHRHTYWISAAAAILIIGMAYLFHVRFRIMPAPGQSVAQRVVNAPPGQKKKLEMPDHTVIYLNGGSSIRYSDNYNRDKREILLDGEAFFDVAGNSKAPFIVKTGRLEARVLGTSFNIRSFGRDAVSVLEVLTGKVGVKEQVLTAGQRLSYDHRSGAFQVNRVEDLKSISAWKTGVLVLNGQNFKEMAVMLERWYNVQVEYDEAAMKHCKFVGKFDRLPLGKVLDMLSKSSSFTYRIQGGHVLIKGAGCQ